MLEEKYGDKVNEPVSGKFELNAMAKDGIDIIQEVGIEYQDWVESSVDSDWTIRTLKLWFFLLSETQSMSWN